MDPFVGKLGVFRVHQGTVTTRHASFSSATAASRSRSAICSCCRAARTSRSTRAVPGDIAAVAKVDEIEFDCVLHDSHDEDHIHMQPLAFPTPMQGVATPPKKRGDEQRICEVLHRMTAEDPTLVVEHDPHSNETVLRGAGRAAPALGARAHVEPVQARDRDAAAAHSLSRDDHRARPRASIGTRSRPAGPGQFGEVSLRVEPLARGTGFEFVDSTKGGVIPHQFMPGRAEGRRAGARPAARSPAFRCTDVRVIVYDGKHHPVDSKEVAFVARGPARRSSTRIDKARPIVLEPIVTVEVICPDVKTGDIAGDLSSRRGQVTGTKGLQPGMLAVSGLAPLAELEGYSARLKSVTGGTGQLDDAVVALRAGAAQPAAAAWRPNTRSRASRKKTDRRPCPDICAGGRRRLQLRPWAIPHWQPHGMNRGSI